MAPLIIIGFMCWAGICWLGAERALDSGNTAAVLGYALLYVLIFGAALLAL